MSIGMTLLLGLSLLLILIFGSIAGYRLVIFSMMKTHRKSQAKRLRFLQVKIQLNSAAKSSDIEAKDHIQSMQQNIQIMNQIYKNVYALYEDGWKNEHLGNNYIGIEMFIEKEIIKFSLAIPQDYVENFEKLIGSFYSGATVDRIPQPKFMEAGKYMYG